VIVGDQTIAERLEFFPFTHDELLADLREVGLEPVESTFAADVDRYLVSARS
jgi:hypothetical protein